MTARVWKGIWLAAGAALMTGGLALAPAASRPRPPAVLGRAYWWWQHPFAPSRAEAQRLRAEGVSRLYVHAGALVARGDDLALESRQRWADVSPVTTLAVVRVHPGAIGRLLAAGGAAAAGRLVREARLPAYVRGLQWDADVPTARLADYARFLRAVRRELPPRWSLSATALPDWLRSRRYPEVCDALDEIAPQFYGNRWPEDGRPVPPIWETAGLLRDARRSAAGRARVWIGLPTYGRCVVRGPQGETLGVRHDLDADRLLDDPAWEVAAARTRRARLETGGAQVPVEDEVALRATTESSAGPILAGAGTELWFQWPRPDGLAAAVERLAVPGVQGVCFFSWEPGAQGSGFRVQGDPPPTSSLQGGGSTYLLPAAEIGGYPKTAVAVQCPLPGGRGLGVGPFLVRGREKSWLPLSYQERRSTHEVGRGGEGPHVRLTREQDLVRVVVRNPGKAAPRLEDGLALEVRPAGGEVLASGPVAALRGDEAVSAARAEHVLLTRPGLRPGHAWAACVVRGARGPVTARLRWRAGDGTWQVATAGETAPVREARR